MTIGGKWGSIDFGIEDKGFSIIASDGVTTVEVPFRDDNGPEIALHILQASGRDFTEAATKVREEIAKVEEKSRETQEIIRWLQETKKETGWVVTKEDRAEFERQKKFWKGGGGC